MVNYQELAQDYCCWPAMIHARALADLRDGFRLKQALGTIEDIAVFITSEWCEGFAGLWRRLRGAIGT